MPMLLLPPAMTLFRAKLAMLLSSPPPITLLQAYSPMSLS